MLLLVASAVAFLGTGLAGWSGADLEDKRARLRGMFGFGCVVYAILVSLSVGVCWTNAPGHHNLDMLSYQQKLAKRLIRLRLQRNLSQREASVEAGFSQPYLFQVEKGIRPISGAALAKLERVYNKKVSAPLWKGIGWRGRYRFTADTRRALAELGASIKEFCETDAPKHAQPHQVRRSSDPLWPMALHLSAQAREEVELLEKLRAEEELFWRQFNSLRFDSWSEKRLLVRVGLLGGQMVGVRLDRPGCSLKLVDGKTGKKPGLHRGFVLKGLKGSVVWCPQVAISTQCGIFCVDNLLVASVGGRHLTVAVEVNGRQYHQDRDRQRWRDRVLGIPVLHLDAGELHKPGLITRILRWVHAQTVAAAG